MIFANIIKNFIISILLFNLTPFSFSIAQEKEKLVIGTKIAEPFVISDENNNWSGISFELWKRIANELHIDYEVREYDLQGLIEAVNKEQIDIAVSPLTITAEREKLLDFTHSYFTTGLSIAVVSKEDNSILSLLGKIFSLQFMEIVSLILFVLFVVGLLVWIFERKKNKTQFGEGISKGLGSGFWWAVVTFTTVGYGDKAPQTVGGRTIAIIWMFAGLIIISSFTAAIASALTVDSLETGIKSENDLHDIRVASINGSSSAEYLIQNEFDFIVLKSIDEGLNALYNYEIDAFVYDAPILKYSIKKRNISNKVKVLPIVLDPINYAFALPTNSNLKEKINQILLREIDNSQWKILLSSYLGGK